MRRCGGGGLMVMNIFANFTSKSNPNLTKNRTFKKKSEGMEVNFSKAPSVVLMLCFHG